MKKIKSFTMKSILFGAKSWACMLCFILMAAIASAQAPRADKIYKTDNTSIDAKVLEITPTEIKYKKANNPDGPTYTIPRSEVTVIVYANGESEQMNQGNNNGGSYNYTAPKDTPIFRPPPANNNINSTTPITNEKPRLRVGEQFNIDVPDGLFGISWYRFRSHRIGWGFSEYGNYQFWGNLFTPTLPLSLAPGNSSEINSYTVMCNFNMFLTYGLNDRLALYFGLGLGGVQDYHYIMDNSDYSTFTYTGDADLELNVVGGLIWKSKDHAFSLTAGFETFPAGVTLGIGF